MNLPNFQCSDTAVVSSQLHLHTSSTIERYITTTTVNKCHPGYTLHCSIKEYDTEVYVCGYEWSNGANLWYKDSYRVAHRSSCEQIIAGYTDGYTIFGHRRYILRAKISWAIQCHIEEDINLIHSLTICYKLLWREIYVFNGFNQAVTYESINVCTIPAYRNWRLWDVHNVDGWSQNPKSWGKQYHLNRWCFQRCTQWVKSSRRDAELSFFL